VLCSLIAHLSILVSVLPPLRLQELASPLRELGRANDIAAPMTAKAASSMITSRLADNNSCA
jgi:hypothetical protein